MTIQGYRAALVTGAGSGIGRAIADDLAARGAPIAVCDINLSAAQEAAERIRSSGGRALAVQMDVTDAAAVDAGFAHAEAELGEIDIAVNSAGLLIVQSLLDFTPDAFARVMAVNVTGSFLVGQRAAKAMVPRRYGRIVNIASISGLRAGVGRTAYGTSKAAVIGLTRQFALELGAHGITTNAVAPGAVETPMTLGSYSDKTWEQVLSMIPARRIGQVKDIASAVGYLTSPDASYVNGDVLAVDGGYLASGMTQTGQLQV